MGHVNVEWRSADQDASRQPDHVARLIIEVFGLDYGKACEQRLALDFRKAVHARLLNQVIFGPVLPRLVTQPSSRLQRNADLVESDDVGLEAANFFGNQAAPGVPALLTLF